MPQHPAGGLETGPHYQLRHVRPTVPVPRTERRGSPEQGGRPGSEPEPAPVRAERCEVDARRVYR